MALNAGSLLKHAFGSLKTPVGKKLVGLFFVVQALNIGGSLLTEAGSTTMMGVGVAVSIGAGILGIMASIGGLRSLREDEVRSELFTQNLLWPFGRILGANITTAVLAYGIGFLFVLPAGILAMLSGAVSPEAVASSGGPAVILGVIGGLLGIGAFFYALVALILAQPLVAIDDKRMFQALDESVQRTKGHRSSIFGALFGIGLAYVLMALIIAFIASIAPDIVATLGVLVIGPIGTAATLSLLNYLTEELPEA